MMGDHDYIRRILAKAQFTGNFQDEYPTALIHALIDDVPAEDVQPVVHGRWENQYPDLEPLGSLWYCSICGTEYDELGFKPPWRFCPYCGARMDE
jgi:rubrerythrin